MGEARINKWGTETFRRSVEGREMGREVHRVNNVDTTGTFMKESREFE